MRCFPGALMGFPHPAFRRVNLPSPLSCSHYPSILTIFTFFTFRPTPLLLPLRPPLVPHPLTFSLYLPWVKRGGWNRKKRWGRRNGGRQKSVTVAISFPTSQEYTITNVDILLIAFLYQYFPHGGWGGRAISRNIRHN